MLLQEQPLARLPRLEGLQRTSRLSKKRETHPGIYFSIDNRGASDFAARLEQFELWNGVFAAEELAVPSDGAPWIRTLCEDIFAGRETTFILDTASCPRTRGRRRAELGDWQRRTEGVDGLDQGAAERRAGRLSHRRSEAAPQPRDKKWTARSEFGFRTQTNAGHRTPPPRRMGAAARRRREQRPVHPLPEGGTEPTD